MGEVVGEAEHDFHELHPVVEVVLEARVEVLSRVSGTWKLRW